MNCLFALGSSNFSPSFFEVAEKLSPEKSNVGKWIGNLEFMDLNGDFYDLEKLSTAKAIVFVMYHHRCPISRKNRPLLLSLMQKYQPLGFQFFLINASRSISFRELRRLEKLFEKFAVVIPDRDQNLAKMLQANATTENFVIDRFGHLLFRGPISDQYGIGVAKAKPAREYLKQALDSILLNRPISEAAMSAPGCHLSLSVGTNAGQLTFHNRISRILQSHCQRCHHPGGGAPFSLVSYSDVADFLPMIRTVVRKGIMPPWFADKRVGRWKNDPTLSINDKRDFLRWLENGAPEGNPKDAPPPKHWPVGWQIGTPSVVLKNEKAIEIPAVSKGIFRYRLLDPKFEEDTWIKAVEIRPTHPQNVHHITVKVVPEDFKIGMSLSGLDIFFWYVPGHSVTSFPSGFARKIPKKSKLLLEFHFNADGKRKLDTTEVGLVVSEQEPKHEVQVVGVNVEEFSIPPNHPNYRVRGEYVFRHHRRIINVIPHMHYRGKSIRFELLNAKGEVRPLLQVNGYNFHWQLFYRPTNPIDVEPGTIMRVTGIYDNSRGNPANPDPSAEVRRGDYSTDEMLMGYVETYRIEDKNVPTLP